MSRAQAATSVEAYGAFVMGPELPAQQAKIVAFLRGAGRKGATRGEIAECTGIRLSSVCGRIGELMDAGTVEERERRPCSVSGVSSQVIRLVPKQGALFGEAT